MARQRANTTTVKTVPSLTETNLTESAQNNRKTVVQKP